MSCVREVAGSSCQADLRGKAGRFGEREPEVYTRSPLFCRASRPVITLYSCLFPFSQRAEDNALFRDDARSWTTYVLPMSVPSPFNC